MFRCGCSLPLHRPPPTAVKQEVPDGLASPIPRARTSFSSVPAARNKASKVLNREPIRSVRIAGSENQSVLRVCSAPAPDLRRRLALQPSPELGLFSLLFVLFAAVGAILSLALISIPTATAFKRLAVSMGKLVKLVSVEVPGTLFSLRLSGLEINDLTQQLSNLRQMISGRQYVQKDRKQ